MSGHLHKSFINGRDMIDRGFILMPLKILYGKVTRKRGQELPETVKQGNAIACTEASRLSRSTKQLCEILEFVEKKTAN